MRLKVQKLPRLKNAFLVTLSCTLVSASACSEELSFSPQFAETPSNVALSERFDGQSGMVSFAERWEAGASHFPVPLQELVPLNQPQSVAPSKAAPDNVKKVTSGSSALSYLRSPTPSAASEKPKNSSIPECGPSPFEPTEIERLVRASARRHGVDEDFAAAIAWAESKFDLARNSAAGARGPMQLMPDTASRFDVQDICDPVSNIEGGIKYLRLLLQEFKNPLLAAAAYNSGEGRIYEHGGVPPFQETVAYVAKVVNRQLGLAMPAPKQKKQSISPPQSPVANTSGEPTGIIPHERRGKFVGGVMHF